jgi:hypothetical protein
MSNEDVSNTKIIKIILNNLEVKLQTLNLCLEKRKPIGIGILRKIFNRIRKLFLFFVCLLLVVFGYYFYIYVKIKIILVEYYTKFRKDKNRNKFIFY